MGRRNKPRRKPQADKRVRLVGVHRAEIDQRKLGRALLRIVAIESGSRSPQPARSGPDGPGTHGSALGAMLPKGDDDDR
ncbi:MAG: hypothetical protein LBK28_09380 [Propionibacteriaceae bacterium]|jgi:hypothetical protein|nr:hypothetical protein [Propionibacteriaceae bacterium]